MRAEFGPKRQEIKEDGEHCIMRKFLIYVSPNDVSVME
jgi:hypothetical protein